MSQQKLTWQTNRVLLGLVVFDALVTSVAFVWPELWFRVIHGGSLR